jgi:3-deoxy-7-phosphoheptulonate synthase
VSQPWNPQSWREKKVAQAFHYEDQPLLEQVLTRLKTLPPLVTSWEIERLKVELAEAQRGERFILQGGDCAETLEDCRSDVISNKLKILLQMSLVLVLGGHTPVTRVGRFAGQYAKPRSKPTEKRTRDDGTVEEHPSYFGDLVNRVEFSAESRAADPQLLLSGYQHAAMTLNFIRSLTAGGFADLHHPEYWDLGFFQNIAISDELRESYRAIRDELGTSLRFMEALGEDSIEKLTRVRFFTSHEGLNLYYESSQTRKVPRREGWYDLTTHMPWIGERTRQIDGGHVEFFRGVRNPIGVKVGPTAKGDDVIALLDVLNPDDEPGKIVLVSRMGASKVADRLPPLLERVKEEGRKVLWICDPMHGNGRVAEGGIKTRSFDDILTEVNGVMDAHREVGTVFGGVHFELTGEDVTECIGGARGITEADLSKNYVSVCDPRLNYAQALEMAFSITRRMREQR